MCAFVPFSFLCNWLSVQERHVSLRVKNLRFLASLNDEALRTQAGWKLQNIVEGVTVTHKADRPVGTHNWQIEFRKDWECLNLKYSSVFSELKLSI